MYRANFQFQISFPRLKNTYLSLAQSMQPLLDSNLKLIYRDQKKKGFLEAKKVDSRL